MNIGLVVFYYPFASSPSLLNLYGDLVMDCYVKLLDANSVATSNNSPLKTSKRLELPQADSGQNTNSLQSSRLYISAKNLITQFLDKINPLILAELNEIRNYLHGFIAFCRMLRSENDLDIYIVADKYSLLPALLAFRWPIVYYSLEVTPLSEERHWYLRILNIFESIFIRLCNPLVISQSMARANLLMPNLSKLLIIPVTCSKELGFKSDFLRSYLGIPDYKKILLCAGSLGHENLTDEILKRSKEWPDDYVLVLHSCYNKYNRHYIEAEANSPSRIILTRLSLSADEAEELIYPSADIGIIQYADLGFNYRNTVFSSGKLAAFLRAGIPLILPNFEEYNVLLKYYKVGIQANPHQISDKVKIIFDNYSSFQYQCQKAYRKYYHYDNYRGKVFRKLLSEFSL